jgi:SAM-dependent methyltransferase
MDHNNSSTSAGDYKKSLAEHGESPKALLWANYRIAAVRYKELVIDTPVEGRSILDAGCGMGDLLPFLYAKSINFRYLGVDIHKGFIEIAKKRYEGHEFKVADPFSKKIGRYDVVISSGVMNGNVSGWLEKRKNAIARLFELANETLAFNMSGGLNNTPDTPLNAFVNLEEIQAFCANLTPRLIVRNHYSSKGFTIVMFK